MTLTMRAAPPRGLAVGCALALAFIALPHSASAAVGGALRTIVPTAATTVDNVLVDPTCDTQGGTSIALVQGSKLAGVDPVRHPVLLAVSCLDNGGSSAAIQRRSRINFLDPSDPLTSPSAGRVVKSIQTTIGGALATPSNGWAHWVHRPDVGDLLACGNDGALYSIDFSRFNTIPDGTASAVPRPAGLPGNCAGLAWDPEEDMVYQGVTGNNAVIGVHRFRSGTDTLLGSFSTPCAPSGLAVTGGALLVACDGVSTILRLDKNTGATLAGFGALGVLGFPAGTKLSPDLGDLACDPVTFHRDPATGEDRFRDAIWSRNGFNGNGVVALEMPPFTCGLPGGATTLWAGLAAPGPLGPGTLPLAACFDNALFTGRVKDADGDGLPDCWEDGDQWPDGQPGIDFDGNGIRDLILCVDVDTNGDGSADTTECVDPMRKDLLVEIDYMRDHRPDPQALSQSQSVASVGVKSIREAFAAAPVPNPDGGTPGIRLHLQVDEQVTFTALDGTPADHVDELVFAPCTPPATNPDGTLNAKSLGQAADFDAIKAMNFGTAAERASPTALQAKRLAFRYVLFAHKQVGLNQGGATNSGCAELGGDDAAITLGGFTATIVGGVSHPRGTTDQQAGTVMHELGHTLGLRHGGHDNVNCKPNYRSVMSYSRQFAGSPIADRRLDYSRAEDPVLAGVDTGRLDEESLFELRGLGVDLSLGPVTQNEVTIFPSADQIAFGPGAWSVVTVLPTQPPINWNRSKRGPNPTFEDTAVAANLNQGAGGCDGSGTLLEGHDDWSNLLYRSSAALEFAGGVHTTVGFVAPGVPAAPELGSITKEEEEALFLAADLDANGVADGEDCGTFTCTHRIDIKPSFPMPKLITLGAEATITVAIFSEVSGAQVWNAPTQVLTDASLTLALGSLVVPAKVNNKGQGTCSQRDVNDPVTGAKDGIKDLQCQFSTGGFPPGTHIAAVSGFFRDQTSGEIKAFRARQEVTILP